MKDLAAEGPEPLGSVAGSRWLRARGSAAPEDVVGDEQGTGSQARSQGLSVRRVLVLQGIDKGQVEWPGELGDARREGVEGGRVDDVDPAVVDTRLAPEPASAIRPGTIRVDRDDPSARRLGQAHPQRRIPDRRADLDDPAAGRGEHREHAAAGPVEDRDSLGLGRGLHCHEHGVWLWGGRLDPVEVRLIRHPGTVALHQ